MDEIWSFFESSGWIIAILVVAFLAQLVAARLTVPKAVKDAVEQASTDETSLIRDTLRCDFVARADLLSIALDKGISLSPEQKTVTRGSTKRAKAGVGSTELGTEQANQETEIYQTSIDNQRLLKLVLSRLEREDELVTDLADISAPGSVEGSLLTVLKDPDRYGDSRLLQEIEEAVGAARGSDGGATSRFPAIQALVLDYALLDIKREKVEHFRSIVKENPAPWVLIEGTWAVTKADTHGVELELARLNSLSGEGDQIEMPNGIGLKFMIPPQNPGSRFVMGDRISAGLFGSPSSYTRGVLRVAPIAVFQRMGSPNQRRSHHVSSPIK